MCYNGAMVVEGPQGRIVFEKDMDENVARAAIDIARSRNLEMVAYRHSQLLFENKGKETTAYLGRVSIPSSIVDFDDFDQLSLTKAIIIASPELLPPVKEALEQRFGPDKLSATYSDKRFLELMGGGVDKDSVFGKCVCFTILIRRKVLPWAMAGTIGLCYRQPATPG